MEVVVVTPNMKILGKELKQAGKKVADHLIALPEDEAMSLKVQRPHPACRGCIGRGRHVLGTMCRGATVPRLHVCTSEFGMQADVSLAL